MNKYYIILIGILIWLILYISDNSDSEYFTPIEVLTEYKILQQNINLLRKCIKFLEKHNIIYWAIGGTMLGAIRDKGMIPWDDDSDIAMSKQEAEKLLTMKNELDDIDIGIAEWFGGYKLYDKKGKNIGHKYKYPFVDIFVMITNENGDYIYENEYTRYLWSDIYIYDELFPLKKYKFEDFYIYSMNNPYPMLNKCFEGWNIKGAKNYDHMKEKKLIKIEFPIEYDKNKKPYLWTYWDNINGKTTPAIIDLCYKTVVANCSDSFDIIRLNKDNILKWLPEIEDYEKDIDKLIIAHKVDVYRIMLLYKYGGLYIDADTIVLKDPIEIINKLDKYEYIGFGCTGSSCTYGYGKPSNGIMASRPHSILMGKVLKKLLRKIGDNRFDYFDLGKYVIWKEMKNVDEYEYYHYPNKYDGTRDKYGNWITTSIIFSNKPIEYEDEKNMIFFTLYNSEINENIHKMTQEELLEKNWNCTKFFKKGLHIE